MQQLRVSWRYLERSLSSAGDRLQTEGPWPYFIGEEQEIRFLTPLPLEAHNLGGYYYWRVWVGRGEDGWGSLVVDESRAVEWSNAPQVENRQVLLHGLRSCQICLWPRRQRVSQVGRQTFKGAAADGAG